MEFVNENLRCMREVYERNGEMDVWRVIETEAGSQQKQSYAEKKADRLGLTDVSQVC